MATTIKAMLNTDRVSKSGYYPIVIRVIHLRKKKLVYTEHRVRIDDFDPLQEKVVWSTNSALTKHKVHEINRDVNSKIRELERAIQRLARSEGDFTIYDIFGIYTQGRDNICFFTYAQRDIQTKENLGKYGTAELYQSTLTSFRRFVVNDKLKFREITYSLLKSYSDHLRAKGNSQNTINMYLRNIRALYNKARKDNVDVGKLLPFEELKINTLPTPKRALSKEALRNIATYDFSSNPKLERVRDLFMFSFYTRGMSFVDIIFLRHTDISSGVIYYKRSKTQQYLQISITPQLKSIIDKYRQPSPFVLPFLNVADPRSLYVQYRRSLFMVNKSLKEIGEIVGIETPLTTYVARHSWATIAKNMGGSIATISEGLGHTTERTTQIYLKAFDHSVIDSLNAKVADL